MFRVLALLFLTFCVTPVTVQAAATYTVAPLVINQSLEARDIFNTSITITNTGKQPATIFPTVNNISVTDGGKMQAFEQRVLSDATASLSAWLEVPRRGFNLAVGESKELDITIRVHPTPTPGEYHAFVGFGYGRIQADAEKMVQEGRAPGTIVTVVIDDKRVESLRLGQFFIDKFVTNKEADAVSYTLANPGDTTVVPTGDIIFYDSRGAEVGSVPVNPDKVPVAPGDEVVVTTQPDVSGFLGKYKGYLTVHYGTNQMAAVTDTVFFYYVPLQYLLGLLGLLLLITIMAAFWVHRRYIDDVGDDADYLHVHVRQGKSEDIEHDIDLKQKHETTD